jgi:hypothetical protein
VAALLAGALISGLFFQVRPVFSLLPGLVVLAVVLASILSARLDRPDIGVRREASTFSFISVEAREAR